MILLGNLGKDPEVVYLESSKVPVAKFSLATGESYMGKDGQRVDQTEWHNIVLWRGLAEVAEKYLKMGSRIYLEGKIRSRSYEDKEGQKRYITEIVGDNMIMLDGRGDSEGQGGSASRAEGSSSEGVAVGQNASFASSEVTDNASLEDDLPF